MPHQGDNSEAKKNTLLGEFEFSGLRLGPKGNVNVEIIFDCNVEGILTVNARDKDTGKSMQTVVNVQASES